ncbi:hypothetical protein [uncultured Clostridium sp.]|uniref:hypothetical protein n=1 Tax=uncultured Clostridium sp. TaxID=59620 RepID=UPI0025FABBF5|nr:hypothetical protein [uncultured Clostridium sp.]
MEDYNVKFKTALGYYEMNIAICADRTSIRKEIDKLIEPDLITIAPYKYIQSKNVIEISAERKKDITNELSVHELRRLTISSDTDIVLIRVDDIENKYLLFYEKVYGDAEIIKRLRKHDRNNGGYPYCPTNYFKGRELYGDVALCFYNPEKANETFLYHYEREKE